MYNEKKVIVIIGAAGKGTRLGGHLPKQFQTIDSGRRTMLQKTVDVFDKMEEIDEILVVTNQDFLMLCRQQCGEFRKVKKILAGGKERQDSIGNAVVWMQNESTHDKTDKKYSNQWGNVGPQVSDDPSDRAIVLVHDGARPFITETVIRRVIVAAEKYGAAVPAVPVKDTIRRICGEEQDEEEHRNETGILSETSETLKRSSLYQVQTPQGFRFPLLKEAFRQAQEDGFYGTDDASLAEYIGHPVVMVEGDYGNYKITTKEDLKEMIPDIRIGSGYDVHRLVPERKLILCGEEIPHALGLLGHSDADVALHALMDAMLGAAALGDIGRHFPDTDLKYKGISSMKLLEEVRTLLEEKQFYVGNADVTILAQKPKLAPHIPAMRHNIAEALNLPEEKISVKATTTEKLGFAGREEGIAAEAVCILYKNSEEK